MQKQIALDPMEQQSTNLPLVSIIIPFYKQEMFIMETVRSVQRQTYPRIEIIVVDDGSPVSAEFALAGVNDILILRTENRGCPAARNLGFSRSSGEFVLFLDSDDRLTPGSIVSHLNAFHARPEAVLSFGAARIIDEYGQQMIAPHLCRPRHDYFSMLLEVNPIACPGAAMIRREAFVKVGLFDETFLIVEDYHLYLRLAKRYPIVRNNFCVVEYRRHGSGSSQQKEKMLQTTLAALDDFQEHHLLTDTELRKIRYGRRRWTHIFRPQKTLAYRMRALYYSFRAMLTVPLRSYLQSNKVATD